MANKKVKSMWKGFVNIVAEDVADEKLAQLRQQYEEIQQDYKELKEAIELHKCNGMLSRIMGKWVKVPNQWWMGENPSSEDELYGYRYFKVVGVDGYEGGNQYRLKVRNIVYVSTDYNQIIFDGKDDSYLTGDITKWKVITEKQVRKVLDTVADRMSAKLKRIKV